MFSKPKYVRNIIANAGVRARYRAALASMIDEMTNSVEYWVRARYNEAPPSIAMDETPAKTMQKELNKLARQWRKKFNDAAPKIAETYVKEMFKHTNSAFRAALKDAGVSVKFTMTPAMRDAYAASLQENIGLIKSIPAQYLQKVQGSAMRSYTAGRDLEKMVSDIKKLYPAVGNRAILIARDQNNKATAVVTRTRQLELGIEEAVWMHSHAGKTPRPSHVAVDGKRYKVKDGMKIDGKFIFPGEEINCRCTGKSVLPI